MGQGKASWIERSIKNCCLSSPGIFWMGKKALYSYYSCYSTLYFQYIYAYLLFLLTLLYLLQYSIMTHQLFIPVVRAQVAVVMMLQVLVTVVRINIFMRWFLCFLCFCWVAVYIQVLNFEIRRFFLSRFIRNLY